LEAGETVAVEHVAVELALWERDRERVRLPFDRGVRFVEVSPDDQIVPVAIDPEGGESWPL
jgi:hypothetical protein